MFERLDWSLARSARAWDALAEAGSPARALIEEAMAFHGLANRMMAPVAAPGQPSAACAPSAGAARSYVEEIARLVWTALTIPLDLGPAAPPARLCDVEPSDRLREIEFHVRSPSAQALGLPAASGAQQCDGGYIYGIIDLVFRHSGRVYVLDWKSNHIEGGYGTAALERKMSEEGYDLQARLYSQAVVQWLAARGQAPGTFGGTLYLFLRGLDPARPGQGILHIPPGHFGP